MSNMITARALALKVSPATLSDLAIIGEAKAEVTRGPLSTMFDLRRDFGEDMANVPEMDTENEAGKPAAYANPEWFQQPTYNPTTGASGTRRQSFFWELADNTSTGTPIAIGERPAVVGGTEIQAILDWITSKMADETYLDKQGLKKERGYWQQRKQENRKNIRKAFQIDQHIRRTNSMCPGLDVIILQDQKRDANGKAIEGQTEVTTSKNAIKLMERNPTVEGQPWIGTYGTFLGMDPEAAKLNGGTLKDLVATATRGGGNGASGKALPPMPFKELEGAAVRMITLLNQDKIDDVIARESKKEGTGKMFAFHLYELTLALTAASASLEPLWKQVNDEADAAEAEARAQRTAATAAAGKVAA